MRDPDGGGLRQKVERPEAHAGKAWRQEANAGSTQNDKSEMSQMSPTIKILYYRMLR